MLSTGPQARLLQVLIGQKKPGWTRSGQEIFAERLCFLFLFVCLFEVHFLFALICLYVWIFETEFLCITATAVLELAL